MRCVMFAAAIAAIAAVAPAGADEREDAIAAVFAAMEGDWSGVVEEWSAESAQFVEAPRTFSCAVTGGDGLDAACWNADGLDWVTYQGEGAFRDRSWSRGGRPSETTSHVDAIEPPGGGRWSLVETFMLTGADQVERDWRVSYTFAEESLSVVVEAREAGSSGSFERVSSGVYRRSD